MTRGLPPRRARLPKPASTGDLGEDARLPPSELSELPARVRSVPAAPSWARFGEEEAAERLGRCISFRSSRRPRQPLLGASEEEVADGQSLAATAAAVAAAAAAGTGAVMTTVMFYPIELIKNRLQSASGGGASGGFAYDGLVDGLSTVLREEGVPGLFTGLQSVVARALASDFATVFFGEALVNSSGLPAVWELPLRVAGGWASVALTLPLELVSTRVTCARPPLSAAAAVRQLWAEDGLRAFWRGLRVMLVLCVNPALTFTAFGWLRRLLLAARARWRGDDEWPALRWWEAFCVGVVAKMATLIVVYPLIRAKFLLQARGGGGEGLLAVLRRVAATQGMRGLYSGLDAQLSKSLLSSALMLAVKEQTEVTWQRWLVPDPRAAPPAGASA